MSAKIFENSDADLNKILAAAGYNEEEIKIGIREAGKLRKEREISTQTYIVCIDKINSFNIIPITNNFIKLKAKASK